MMSADAVPEMLDQFEALDRGAKAVDLLLVSKGGDPNAAWRIVTALRERVDHIAVLVPQAAFSAATLVAMGADEIVMHPYGNLGPVDMTVNRRGGPGTAKEAAFTTEDLAAFLEYVRTDVGLTEQRELRKVFERFCEEVGASTIGIGGRAAALSVQMGEKLLRFHMTGDGADASIKRISAALSKGFMHHGYPVGRREARELGLPVTYPDAEVEGLMWQIWLDVEREMNTREPWDPSLELLGKQPPANMAPISLPPNLPPEVLQRVAQEIGQQALKQQAEALKRQGMEQHPHPVPLELLMAVVESLRHATRLVHRGQVIAVPAPPPNAGFAIQAVIASVAWYAATFAPRAVPTGQVH
jgi:hypothetical protein